jgi:hypothetical protein
MLFRVIVLTADSAENRRKFANSRTFGFPFIGPPQYSHSGFTLTFSIFTLKILFRLVRSLIFSSLKNCLFLLPSILDKSISGLTYLMGPIFTSRLKRALTVGVLPLFLAKSLGMTLYHSPLEIRELRHQYDQGLHARMQ